jgi:hypothetical protein
MQVACYLKLVGSPWQVLQHLSNIAHSYQSKFDSNVQHPPWNLGDVPFPPLLPLFLLLIMFIV